MGTGFWVWVSSLDPLAKWTLGLVAIAAALLIADKVRSLLGLAGAGAVYGKAVYADSPQRAPKSSPAVEFWLPSKWEPGFRFKNLGLDEKQRELLAEEVHVRVVAKKRMQDVRFEIAARQRIGNQLELLQAIGSDRFVGVVTPGLDQGFLIMRRTFSMVTAVHKDLTDGHEIHQTRRVDRGVVFFPENAKATFAGNIGATYHFSISVHHDDGEPDTASFSITLDEKREPVISKMWGRTNIEPITD